MGKCVFSAAFIHSEHWLERKRYGKRQRKGCERERQRIRDLSYCSQPHCTQTTIFPPIWVAMIVVFGVVMSGWWELPRIFDVTTWLHFFIVCDVLRKYYCFFQTMLIWIHQFFNVCLILSMLCFKEKSSWNCFVGRRLQNYNGGNSNAISFCLIGPLLSRCEKLKVTIVCIVHLILKQISSYKRFIIIYSANIQTLQ